MEFNKEKNFVSAVIYIHNNEQEISSFLKKVNKVLTENFEKYEIICVNDASQDRSAQNIKAASEEIGESVVSIVNMSYFQGEEAAMNAGVDLAIGDFVFEFDTACAAYDFTLIRNVYDKALTGFDIVSASPSKKRSGSKLFYFLFNKYAHMQYALSTESFRILSRRAINRVQSISKTIPYRKALYANCGLKVFRMVYKSASKKQNETQKREPSKRKLALSSLILFTDIGYVVAKFFTIFMMLTTFLCVIYTIYIYVSSMPVAGWTTTMLILSTGIFGLSAVLTIIIKYLSILVNLIFIKQKYVIESIEKM